MHKGIYTVKTSLLCQKLQVKSKIARVYQVNKIPFPRVFMASGNHEWNSHKHCQRRNQKINFGEATSDGHPSPFHLLLNFLTAVTETAWRPKQQCRDRFPRAATCYRGRGASLSPQAQAYSVVTSLDTVRCSHKSSVKTTHPFNGPLSGTTQVSRYQKDKNNLDFTEARDSEWQWHQLSHMQICTSLQTNTNASTPPLSFFTGRMPFLPPNQQCQSIEGTSQD